MSEPIGSIGVVGGGFMGAGIAEVAAVAGMDIVVVVRKLPVDAARHRLESSLARAVKRGKLDAADRDSALAQVTLTSDLKELAGAELVVESVPEDIELKTSIMKTLGGIVNDDAIIASNTSSIPIAQLANRVPNPDRVVGVALLLPRARDEAWSRSYARSTPATTRSSNGGGRRVG